MGKAGNGGIGLLAEGIEPEAGVIGLLAGGQGHELRPDRVLDGLAPIDEREKVGRDAQGHWRALQSIREILEEAVGNQMAEGVPKLLHVGDRVACLKSVSVKFSGRNVREGRE